MSQKVSVLIIEDEKNICDFMSRTLLANDYKVQRVATGEEGLRVITSNLPDIIILDLGLPDMDGIDVLKKTREWSSIPIIIVSARSQEKEKVLALDLGADDYIVKPFGTNELLARIRTAIRHNNKMSNGKTNSNRPYSAKGLIVDFEKRRVLVNDEEIHLTRMEYKIVSILAKNNGKVITYEMLINEIWGPYVDDNNRTLRVNMANIRRKIEKNPAEPLYILTEVGVGYRMIEDESL